MPLQSFVQQLQARPDFPPLFPTEPFDPSLSQSLLEESASLFGPDMSTHAAAVLCGLLLWNDDLQSSHPISQDLKNATGSFWHAVIHRREGDFNNSNYWWRLTGLHPAFPDVHQAALEALQAQSDEDARDFAALLQQEQAWQPEAFVACCRKAKDSATDNLWLRQVQLAEMKTLLAWCRNNRA